MEWQDIASTVVWGILAVGWTVGVWVRGRQYRELRAQYEALVKRGRPVLAYRTKDGQHWHPSEVTLILGPDGPSEDGPHDDPDQQGRHRKRAENGQGFTSKLRRKPFP